MAFASIALVGACSDNAPTVDAERRGPDAIKIIAEAVELRQDVRRVEAVGTARARQSAVIYPESGGEVIVTAFSAGDFVTKGDVIARLDDASERLAAARARVAVRDAEQLLVRYERIDVPGAISDSQIDEAHTALDAARIELDLAELSLARRTIRAPFSGHVGLSDVDAGARITTATEVTRLDDRSVLFVDFAAPEEVFGGVNIDDALPMQPFAADGVPVTGTVAAVDSRIDEAQRSFTIRAQIDNAEDRFRPGMSFRVDFDLPGQAFPTVPEEAIVWGGDGAYIWAVVDGAAERMPVTLISRNEGAVLVQAPLEAGDLIIVEGVNKVREGAAVDVILAGRDTGARQQTGTPPVLRTD